MDRLADGAQRLGEVVHGMLVGHIARLEMHLRDAVIIAADETVENLGEEAALRLAEAAHDTEIDGDDVAGLVDKEIALVHVGVEEAVAQRLAQERLHQPAGEQGQVVAGGAQRFDVGELDAVHPVEGEHVARRLIPFDRRDAEPLIAGGEFREFGERRRLEPEIHLQRHRACERVDHRDRPQAPRRRVDALDETSGDVERVEVAAETLANAGAEHLDGDGAGRAVADRQFGLVDLGDGCGGDRWREGPEQRLDRLTERPGDRGARFGLGKRRNFIAQPAKRVGAVLADEVRSRRQELAKLDVGGTEPVERDRQALAAAGGGNPPSLEQAGDANRGARARPADRPAQPARTRPRAPARSRRRPAGRARREFRPSEPQSFQPECMAAIPPERLRTLTRGEAGAFDHRGKARLVGKAADRLDEIAVRLAVADDEVADHRDHVEGEQLVQAVETSHIDGGEFETEKTAARPEDAEGLRKSALDPRHVADTEGDGDGVVDAVLERQVLGICFDELEPVSEGAPRRAFLPTASISALISATVMAAGAERDAMRKAMSPVPPAISSTRNGTEERRGGASQVTNADFHRR